MSLKVVKFDTKMYLNFSNFRGRTSAGGGQALVQKWGQVSDGGGLAKFSLDGGTPPVPPPGKNPGDYNLWVGHVSNDACQTKLLE